MACVAYVDNGVHAGCNRAQVAADQQMFSRYRSELCHKTHDEVESGTVSAALIFNRWE